MGKSTKRKDGSLVKTITDPKTGKRKYFYGKTEREINKKILEYNRESEKGKSFKKRLLLVLSQMSDEHFNDLEEFMKKFQ